VQPSNQTICHCGTYPPSIMWSQCSLIKCWTKFESYSKNIKMIFNRYAWIIIIQACIVIMLKSNMDKNINIKIMPQHWLHLILDFKIIVFNEINNWNHIVSKKRLYTCFKLFFLPLNFRFLFLFLQPHFQCWK
jgi:hypothetical protein